jgi:hypothetical protein
MSIKLGISRLEVMTLIIKENVMKSVVLFLLLFSYFPLGQAAENCLPPNVKEGKKYYVRMTEGSMKIKVHQIIEDSCWVKVSEIFPTEDVNPELFPGKKEKFWLNFNSVYFFKNKD